MIFLGLSCPKRFNYQPGDYIFLKIPAIAKYEWHPFTMSSSPEQDFLGLHIRSVGTWTNKLFDFVDKRTKATRRNVDQAEKKLRLEPPPGGAAAMAKEKESQQEVAVTIDGCTRNMDTTDKKLEV